MSYAYMWDEQAERPAGFCPRCLREIYEPGREICRECEEAEREEYDSGRELITLVQAAEMLRCSVSDVVRLADRGKLERRYLLPVDKNPFYRPPVRFLKSDVAALRI